MCQINTEKMKQQNGCLDVNVPPDIDYLKTSQDVVAQEMNTEPKTLNQSPEHLCSFLGRECDDGVLGVRSPHASHHLEEGGQGEHCQEASQVSHH